MAGLNDIWLQIDFETDEFEMAVASYILHLLGRHYGPLSNLQVRVHCQATSG